MKRRPGPAAALLVLLAACGGGTPAFEAEEPVEAKAISEPAIAVTRSVTGNPPRRELVLFSAAGVPLRLLASKAESFAGGASWSPDGRRIAFARSTRRTDDRSEWDVYVAPLSGGPARRLTDTGRSVTPAWSPDGRTIVFARLALADGSPPQASLWAVAAEGGNARRLTEDSAGVLDLPTSFSPDGSALAFTRLSVAEGGEQERYDVHLLDVETLEERRAIADARDAAFSPDGQRIAYATGRDRNGSLSYGDRTRVATELYVSEIATGDERRLTRTKDVNELAPSWSPDGRLLAYQRGRVTGNAEASNVFTMRPDGSCSRPVAFDPGLSVWYSGPAWHPGAAPFDCRPAPKVTPPVPLAGNMTLAQAARFRPFRVLWLGQRFDRFVLSGIWTHNAQAPGGRGRVVNLAYGGIDLQIWAACARVPAHVAGEPDKRVRVRGVEAVFFEGGYRMEIVTGRATVVAFGPHRLLLRAARLLRPVGAARPAARLPQPAAGAVAGRLRCG